MTDDLHGAVMARLRTNDQRYTAGRRSLIEVLRSTRRPLTAAEILDEADVAQSSTYRNLAVLESCGIVHRVAGSDEFARFELTEDLTEHHHHHLICTGCGAVSDFTVSDQIEASLDQAMEVVAAATGFRPTQHRLDLIGRCASCR